MDFSGFLKVLYSSKHIIAVAGAGLSASSRIPTYRRAELWRNFDGISLATPEAFEENPSRLWQFYHYRREKGLKAKENNAHKFLAKFSLLSTRDQLMPQNKGTTFTLITQNVDGLSQHSLNQITTSTTTGNNLALVLALASQAVFNPSTHSTQPPLLEMHGRLYDLKCTSCPHISHNTTSPIVPALSGTEFNIKNTIGEISIPLADLPRCEACGSLARPGVVWFGEMPYYLDEIDELVERADMCLVIGTSSTVYPAAGYASEVQANGGKVAVFNLERSEGDDEADFLFLGPCEVTLPRALGMTV